MTEPQSVPALFRLRCGVNNYAWGKDGSSSTAAKFSAASGDNDFEIDEDKPYAELWMGTHPSLPAKDFGSGKTLLEIINTDDNAERMLTAELVAEYGKQLPYLFKILSIKKALSIQAHPNKTLAKQIHAKDPKNYPDDNHKPEMTIALTAFEGLCGFRPLPQIRHFLASVAPFRRLVGDEAAAAFETGIKPDGDDGSNTAENKALLKSAFSKMMSATEADVEEATAELIDGIKSGSIDLANPEATDSVTGPEMAELVCRLNGQYPNDIGLFNLFFLNYVKMEPGEAMFLQADDIHAYISGDIIECMASSDNVVRAGFTPKFKDVSTLTSMLTYCYAPIADQKMTPSEWPWANFNAASYSSGSDVLLYNPPIPEFAVIRTRLPASAQPGRGPAVVKMAGIDGPSVIICTSGTGTISAGEISYEARPGLVFFASPGTQCTFTRPAEEGGDDFVTYRAICAPELAK